ncbi:ATP-dependent translocase ABCB1-like isoform X3 [Biomphalaria glabrata]|uniref:ATP-dependent translocase ABCB1-like isoform X3 n=1 Tax=Biomphalaria glabrata TaxID=6526 RepID=A0A9W2YN07_BIOGL|nr:ATP-dependent translocase ABCB1-like isoform X3 [Biomphalaria glabrata]
MGDGVNERTPLLGDTRDEGKPLSSETIAKSRRGEKSDKEVKRTATFGELYSFSTCCDKFLIFLGFLMAMAHGASWPLLFLIFGNMTNDFINYGKNSTLNGTTFENYTFTNSSIGEMFEEEMTQYALKYIYIGLAVCAATYIHIAFLQISCERQTLKLRRAFFKALLRENIGWYDKQQSGELTTRLADDLERVKEGTGDKSGLALQFLSQFLAGFLMGFIKGWKMTLVLMSLTPILAICAAILGKLLSTYSAREQEKYAKAGAIAEEVLSCIRTVISFNGHSQEIKKYSLALEESKKLGIRKSIFAGLSVGLTFFIMFCAYGLAFWFGSTQVNDYNKSDGQDGLSPGNVFTIFFSVMIGSFALGSAAPHITTVMTAKGAGGTVFSIIIDKPPIDSSDPGGQKPNTVNGYIQFKDVEFTYPTRPEVKVLKNFNLDIEPGKTVALVGSSGCGKSTIVNLIQRFYDPDSGRIILDGIDIKDLNIQWLRKNIGIVSQEPVLFGMSIEKNITLGNPGINMEEVERAAKMANAHDFISQLPKGYDTLVGERGAQLSGGQKQRVAIARALVRDPRILLLDEATSALDSESEGIVQAALDKAREGRTTVIVAHRLSTIQNADVIYVLDKGEVVEMGKHQELMKNKGTYFNLVTLQTLAGKDESILEEDNTNIEDEKSSVSPQHTTRQVSQKQDLAPHTSTHAGEKTTPTKKINLFKSKSETPEEDQDVLKPGFLRMFKSNLKEWPFILLGCIGAIANGLVFPVYAVFFSEIITTFGKTGQDLLDQGLFWSMMFLALGGITFVANICQNVAFGFSGERLTKRLRQLTFQNILRQDVEYFDNPKHSTGALTTRLATDASMVKNATGIRLATIVQSITSMGAGIGIAFAFGWKLALAVLGGVPLLALAGMLNMKLLKANQERDSKLLEEAGKTASECVENIRTVQSLTREKYFFDQYSHQLIKPHKENIKQAHVYGLSYAFSQGMIFFIYAGAFRFGAWLVANDGMDPNLVFRVFFAIAFTGISVGQAASFLPDYTKAQLSAGYIFTMLDIIPKIDIFNTSGTKKENISGEIKLDNVHFHYPTRPDVHVLKGVSMHVRPGQTAALVGMSGCGKSTIVSLVQRYYDPSEGAILIEGVDTRDYNLKSLRSLISVVSQEPVLFDCSIRENISYGIEQQVPMADIIAAAQTANAHDFITNLPDGYETQVGEKGTQLSGGQKQRVAIARALIRNPRILLLDEATSALDTESEKIVQTALDRAREGRTCIVIAHRLSTIQNADIIYVMEQGRIVESGTHQELLSRKGVYSILVQGQQFRQDTQSSP